MASNKFVYILERENGTHEYYNSQYELLSSLGIDLERMHNEYNAYVALSKHRPDLKKAGSDDPVAGEWIEFPGFVNGMNVYRADKQKLFNDYVLQFVDESK